MTHDPHRVVQVGSLHVHLAVEPRVVLQGGCDETLPPLLECFGQLVPANRVPLRRKPLHRVVDHRVAQPAHQLRRGRLEGGAVHLREHPAVDLGALRHPAFVVPVAVLPVHELRVRGARRRHQQAAEPGEGLVAVFGQRLEQLPAVAPEPAPLLVVPVPVRDPQVEEPGPQQGSAVDPGLAREGARPQLARREDLDRARKARRVVRTRQGKLLDRARLAAERLAELAERRVVGHEHVARVRVHDARGLGERGHDEAVAGVVRRGRVLEQLGGNAVRPLRRQDLGRVLVGRPERVALAVLALERQAQALHASDLPHGREPAAKRREVQDREIDRSHPLLAVAGAHEQVVERGRVVALPSSHHPARLGSLRSRGQRRGGKQCGADPPTHGGPY